MSKAFTKESDDAPDEPLLSTRPRLPPGVKNYITSHGAQRLRDDMARLLESRAALLGEESSEADSSKLLRLDSRIRQLEEMLQTIVVVETSSAEPDRVRFGATVTVREGDGQRTTYRIVGVDEMDLDRDWISWLSPLAKALLGRTVGERVRFRAPNGERELEIIEIRYRMAA